MSVLLEHVKRMEAEVVRIQQDEHITAPDLFVRYADLRLALHVFKKVAETYNELKDS